MKPAPITDGTAAATIVLSIPRDPYVHRLRALAAWWSLGSSGLEPQVWIRYAPVPPSSRREAGL
jgi:hypothetical protein